VLQAFTFLALPQSGDLDSIHSQLHGKDSLLDQESILEILDKPDLLKNLDSFTRQSHAKIKLFLDAVTAAVNLRTEPENHEMIHSTLERLKNY
jgi:hypothetical protein